MKLSATSSVDKTRQLLDKIDSVIGVNSAYKAPGMLTASLESYKTSGKPFETGVPAQLARSIDQATLEMYPVSKDNKNGSKVTQAQKDAAKWAAITMVDPKSFTAMPLNPMFKGNDDGFTVSYEHATPSEFPRLQVSKEAFMDTNIRDTQKMSIGFNFSATQQGEFEETLFPAIVIPPQEVGVTIETEQLMVMNNVTRTPGGDVDKFDRRPVVEAYLDHTILEKNSNRAIPVYSPITQKHFVDEAICKPWDEPLAGKVNVRTNYLSVKDSFSLINICQREAILAQGVMDQTDNIDATVVVKSTLLKIGNDVIAINTRDLPTFNFIASIQQNKRLSTLTASTNSILITPDTKQVDGSDLVTLALVKSGNKTVRLSVEMFGRFNDETGEATITPGNVRVYQVTNSSKHLDPLDVGDGKVIADAVKTGEIVGWEPLAFYTNENRRLPTQLADTQYWLDQIKIPGRSGVSYYSRATNNNEPLADAAARLDGLVKMVRVILANEAVTALHDAWNTVLAYTDARDAQGMSPDIPGIGRYYIRSCYEHVTFNVAENMDSLSSRDKAEDLRHAFINRIRDMATKLYVRSNYKAASEILNGGIAQFPTLVVACGQEISQWLALTGELRMAAGSFDVRVVTSTDLRMKDIIYLTFGVFDTDRNVRPNPLNFGNLYWSPEVVLEATLNRGGSYRHETMVRPRYQFSVNCHIMGRMEVSGLTEAIGKNIFRTQAI